MAFADMVLFFGEKIYKTGDIIIVVFGENKVTVKGRLSDMDRRCINIDVSEKYNSMHKAIVIEEIHYIELA